jgi:hypothetical protein
MKIRGLGTAYLIAGLALSLGCQAVYSAPLMGPMRGQNIVRISNDRGGYVIQYASKLETLKQAGTQVQFTGRCLSACTLYLALPKSQTCVASRASFTFHAAYGSSPRGNQIATSYMLNKYPSWVRSWISNQGGLSRRLMTMPYGYASKHMRPCETATAVNARRATPKKSVRAQQPSPTRVNFSKAAASI